MSVQADYHCLRAYKGAVSSAVARLAHLPSIHKSEILFYIKSFYRQSCDCIIVEMQSYLLAVTLALLPSAYSDCDYPIFAACDSNIVSTINTFRRTTEVNSDGPYIIEPGKRFYAVHTSYDYKNTQTKYIYVETSLSTMNFTFVLKDGDQIVSKNYTKQQNEDGTLTGAPLDPTCPENRKYKWFTVLKGKGFIINYVCNGSEGPTAEPLTAFFVTKESYNNSPLTKTLFRRAVNLLKSLGFNIKYSYEEFFSPTTGHSGLSGLMPGKLPLSR